MLDLDHPHSANIFAAARQLDLILDCCKQMTLAEGPHRLFVLEIMRPAFAALRWLNEFRFDNSASLAKGVDALESQATALAQLPSQFPGQRGYGSLAACPVCGKTPRKPDKYDPKPYCPHCLKVVMPSYGSVSDGFGTEFI